MTWEWLTQFRCATIGNHKLSQQQEDTIYELKIKKGKATCKWCGVTLDFEVINDCEYELTWNPYP